MHLHDIAIFLRNHWLLIGPGIVTLTFLKLLILKFGIYTWYGVVLVVVFIWANLSHQHLYFYVFLLGFVTAFTEILGKFSDEPIKVLKTIQCLIYHVFNGCIAMLALYMITVFHVLPESTEADAQVKAVLLAGFGSMVIMRSKFFTAKIGDEDVSIGPEQVIKVFFNFMDKGIDRIRAQARIDLVVKVMKNIDCTKVYEYSLTMLESAQTIADGDRTKLTEDISKILVETPLDPQLKSYRLGFLLLDHMGEDFVTKIFSNAPAAWQMQASPIEEQGAFSKLFGTGEKVISYFAYAQNMSTKALSQRLNWSKGEAKTYLERAKPQKASLSGYRLVFNKPSGNADLEGFANIEPASQETVEGVLYQLPVKVIEFLDLSEPGYRRIQLPLEQNGKQIQGEVYIAESPRAGLKPTHAYLQSMLAGAREYELSDGYIQELRSQATVAARTVTKPPPELEAIRVHDDPNKQREEEHGELVLRHA